MACSRHARRIFGEISVVSSRRGALCLIRVRLASALLTHPRSTTMPKCLGCGVNFVSARAIGNHYSKTSDPRCLEAGDAEAQTSEEEEFGSDLQDEFPTGGGHFAGDFFGDNYTRDDLGYDSDKSADSDSDSISASDSQDDDDDPIAGDYAAAAEAQAGEGWEPPRPTQASQGLEEDSEMDDISATITPAREKRKIAEDRFHETPVIVKFPSHRAGEEIPVERSASAEEQYGDALGKTTNVYAPFASKMDWEVARWAKLRGSGSTAFTELLKIEGVSILS